MRALIALGTAAVLAAALVGCSAGTRTVIRTVTAEATVTVTADPSPSVSASQPITPIGAPTHSGNNPNSEACKLLTVAEVEAATGVAVIGINGGKNPLNHTVACGWTLAPVADCGCANFGVTLQRGWSPGALAQFEQKYVIDVREHRATALQGIAHGEISTGKLGEFGSAEFLSGAVIVSVGDRMGYLWKPADTSVLLKLIPLIAARAPKA